MKRWGVAALLLLSACVHSSTETHHGETAGKPETTGAKPPPGATTTMTQQPSPSPVAVAPVPSPKPVPVMVRVMVRSVPNHSLVYWGQKEAGRDPGAARSAARFGPRRPLHRASPGLFPISHARAYTFRNDTVYARLTTFADRMTIFGAKEELPPSPAPSPMPGATPPVSVAAPPAAAPSPKP